MKGPMPRLLLVVAALHVLSPLPAAAQDPAAPSDTVRAVSIVADFGLVDAAGNSDVTSFTASERLEWKPAASRWILSQTFKAVYGRTDGETSAESYRGSARADRRFTDHLQLFVAGGREVGHFRVVAGGFERDRFAGISRRFEELVGVGARLLDRPRHTLEIEAGTAFTQQRSIADVDDNFVAARGAATWQYKFTDAASLRQQVEVLENLEETDDLRINSETALVAPLSRRIAIKVAYVICFDNVPEPTFGKTDRVLSSGVQVSF